MNIQQWIEDVKKNEWYLLLTLLLLLSMVVFTEVWVDSKFSQISRTLLSILVDFNSAMI